MCYKHRSRTANLLEPLKSHFKKKNYDHWDRSKFSVSTSELPKPNFSALIYYLEALQRIYWVFNSLQQKA